MNIKPILNVIAYPGALIRAIPIYIILRTMGWNSVTYYNNKVGMPSSVIDRTSTGGFSITMYPPKDRKMKFNQTIIIVLISYLTTGLILLWLLYSHQIIIFLLFTMGPIGIQFYYFMTISLIIGGFPTQSETMLSIKHYIMYNPHIVMMLIINFFASAIISYSIGSSVGIMLFVITSAISLLIDKYYKREIEKLEPDDREINQAMNEFVAIQII